MQTPIAQRLDIEFPIFAFTHCRDVVAAVCNAGGMGVLGAVGFTVDQLRQELDWLDEHVEGTYGVDIVIPGEYEGMDEMDPEKLEETLKSMIPDEVRSFAKRIFDDAGVPELSEDEKPHELLGFGLATAMPLLEEAISRPKCSLIANALGTPPGHVIEQVQSGGRLIGALCGSVKHALNHKEAGLDFVVCQGGEGGGHTGDVGSIVLWPEVIEAVGDTPVLAAGGVGSGKQMAAAMVMGAQGVWTGSLWLTVEEADIPPGQMDTYMGATSRDTIRSRSWTGKPCRMLRNDWTEAWEQPDTPDPLGMPMQSMVSVEAMARGHRYPVQAKDVNFMPCGQIIGRFDKVRRSSDVILEMVEEFVECMERGASLLQVEDPVA
ncbi:MAG: nitronate monooxygenase family protein [Acidimicrobiales bacterium]|nr:nitronate monooxygenase family protein [Acidimicrobiales bacterium]